MYNLDVGEHYYSPMTNYLESERGTRGETPGALTYDERLHRQWLHGRRYEPLEFRERYQRASSVSRGEASSSYLASEVEARKARAMSEMRATSAMSSRQAVQASATSASMQRSETSMKASRQEQSSMKSTASAMRQASATTQQTTSVQQKKASMASSRQEMLQKTQVISESKRKIDDDIIKRVADVRMSPWSKGQELDEANAASARARARILELEKELEEITRKAMTSQVKALKTAKQMAAEATREDEAAMASSFKKSKKVMIESSSKIVA